MVGIDGSKWSQAVTHHGKEGHKHTVDDVNCVDLLLADVNPADKEENPGKTEKGDEGGVEGDKESERSLDVLTETLEATLESGTARVQHMSNVVVEFSLFLGRPSFEVGAVGEGGVVRVGQAGGDGITSLHGWWRWFYNRGFSSKLFLASLLPEGALCPLGLRIVLGQYISRSSIEPTTEIGNEEGVLDIGQGRKSLNLGVCYIND